MSTSSAQPLPVLAAQADPAVAADAARLADEAIGPRDIRAVKTLRVSVTDRCNLRCTYCMPAEGMKWIPKGELLDFDEIVSVAQTAIGLGVRNFKITGGEPLLRQEVETLVARLHELPGVGELSLTTNGLLLAERAEALKQAGIRRVTVSLDTLRADRFRELTRTGQIEKVWEGIEAAEAAGLSPLKLNVVVLRDTNLDEVADFAGMTRDSMRQVRFIEFMPLGASKALTGADQFVPYDEIRSAIERVHGPLTPTDQDAGDGPARHFRIPGATGKLGFIHAMSAPFCSTCNRLRLTPEGQLRSCLFDGGEVDLKPLLRAPAQPGALRQAFIDCVRLKPDRHQMYGNRQMSQIGG